MDAEDGGPGEVLEDDRALLEQLDQLSGAVDDPHFAHQAWWTTESAMTMCSLVLLFGLFVIVLSAGLALRRLDKDVILKATVIPMAVMLAVFLVVAGYSDSQVAPAMGLLGTVVGYVLGTTRDPPPSKTAGHGDRKPAEPLGTVDEDQRGERQG